MRPTDKIRKNIRTSILTRAKGKTFGNVEHDSKAKGSVGMVNMNERRKKTRKATLSSAYNQASVPRHTHAHTHTYTHTIQTQTQIQK